MNQTTKKFELWCVVELFGHAKIAGWCTEENIAGANMLRVDVPETPQQPAFTRWYGSSAIYSIIPVDETTCRFMVSKLQAMPIDTWDVKKVMEKHNQLAIEAEVRKDIHTYGDGFDDDNNPMDI